MLTRSRYLFASLVLCSACDGPDATTTDAVSDGDNDTFSDTTSGDVALESEIAASACLVDVPCVIDDDCTPGTRCNLALPEPECQTIRCGAAGSVCSDDALCTTGLSCNGDTVPAQCGIPVVEPDPSYLMSMTFGFASDKPLAFNVTLSLDPDGSTLARLQAIAMASGPTPGAPIGEVYEARNTPNTDYMILEFGEIEIPAEANPIVLSSMRIVLTLQSRCLDGVDCLCGDAFGEVVDPFVASLSDGSTWGTAEPGTPSFDVPSACR